MNLLTLQLALRELRQNRTFHAVLAINLAIGIAGFLTLDSFKSSIENSTSLRSKALLSADIAVSARRRLDPKEQQILDRVLSEHTGKSETIEFFTMAASKKRSRLVQVKAVDEHYPFYGELQRAHASTTPTLGAANSIWIAPELQTQLGVALGDPIKLGDQEFVIRDLVTQDSASTASMLSLAPRVYLHVDQLEPTKLLQPGSSINYTQLFRLPEHLSLEKVASQLNADLTDPGIRVITHRDASEQVARAVKYLNDYLGLATLTAFFLASIGGAYLFRAFLSLRIRDIAVLRALGTQSSHAVATYAMLLWFVGMLALIPAAAASAVMIPLLTRLLQMFFPFELDAQLSTQSIVLGGTLATLGNLLICLPLILKIRNVPTQALFQEQELTLPPGRKEGLWLIPMVFFYAAAAVWQSKSWVVGGIFIASLLTASAVLMGIGWVLLEALKRIEWQQLAFRIAARQLARHKIATLACFLALSIGTLLVNLVSQLQAGIQSELNESRGAKLPSFFLFDIQEDQKDGVVELIQKEGAVLAKIAPLIRARLMEVNGSGFAKDLSPSESGTREQEVERRFRNRGFNLSYQEQLTSAESIISGPDISNRRGSHEVSVEREFAKRLGLKIGDKLRFDIQGLPFEAQVANLRRIRWTSFQPNFFLQLAPGALDDAPKTFLASIAPMDEAKKELLQTSMVEKFPNVSLIDVAPLVTRILGILTQMGWALQLMAYLSLLAGLVVLISIANEQSRLRRWDTALLKTLGAQFEDVRRIHWIEFGLLAEGAALFGTIASWAMSYVLATTVFESPWVLDWRLPLASCISVPLIAIAIVTIVTQRTLRESPILLLSSARA